MGKRKGVKCYLPQELKPYMDAVIKETGLSESEILRLGFIRIVEEFRFFSKVIDKKTLILKNKVAPFAD